ncbi:MAG: hypothetical protein PVI30_01060 [Myxococcales bacterium]
MSASSKEDARGRATAGAAPETAAPSPNGKPAPPPPPTGAHRPPPPPAAGAPDAPAPPATASAGAAPIAQPERSDAKRSTMEFVHELDAPATKPSVELDLASMPDVNAAIARAEQHSDGQETSSDEPAEASSGLNAPSMPATQSAAPREQAEPADDAPAEPLAVPEHEARPAESDVAQAQATSGHPGAAAFRAPPPKRRASAQRALTAEQHLEQRRRRVIVRIQTCRDAFRLLGFLGITDDERAEVARMLMGLERTISPDRADGETSPVKQPDVVLKNPGRELLDRVEAELSPIEERLLSLDDLVEREVFRKRVSSGKHPLKLLARYGRLLASRRFNAGFRRDRFEWLATYLLTRRDEAGRLQLVPKDQAKTALQHLIGGLPHKVDRDELQQALTYLRDALTRLESYRTPEDFFDSGYFLDVHGYKVSMRDQLLNADFVYLSAAINAKLDNLLEHWIGEREASHESNRLTQEGSPREQIMGQLREQEQAVDNIFGVKRQRPKRKVSAREKAETERRAAEGQAKAARRRKHKKKKLPRINIAFDAQLAKLIVATLLAVGAIGFVLTQTGAIEVSTPPKTLVGKQVHEISPMLVRGILRGPEGDRNIEALIHPDKWAKLNQREREDTSAYIAEQLAKRGVKSGKVTDGNGVVIQFEDGIAIFVESAP